MGKIIVHGVHRSGTSLTSSLLAKAGCWYAEDKYQMSAREDNPRGFWERLDVVELNDDILNEANLNWFTIVPEIPSHTIESLGRKFGDRLREVSRRLDEHSNWFVKDPRFSLTWPLWKCYLKPRYHIVVHRHPVSVARSLNSRDNIPIEHGLIFWYHQSRMIASLLVDEENLLTVEFGSKQYSGIDALDTINSVLNLEDGLRKLDQADFDSLYDSALVNHSEQDESVITYPEIDAAWKFAKAGNYRGLLSLPEISTAQLSWQDLDSRSALATQLAKSERELNQHKEEIEILSTDLVNKIKESESNRETIRELHDQVNELNDRLITIAGELKSYMISKRYILSSLFSKIGGRLHLTKHRTLHNAFNISKFGHSAADLRQVLPEISNRQRLVTAIARNPSSFLRRMTPSRILNGFSLLLGRGEGDIGVKQALLQYANADLPLGENIELFDPDDYSAWADETISFNTSSRPLVSIVIPVYNNYLTTLACLHSIKKFTNGVDYEVIIADDCSTDETATIEQAVQGVRVIRGDTNFGFLQNCNNAIQHAEGEFVALINNDTNVQADWLQELLEPLQQDAGIGVTGPIFVYPDGRLQEAGGIVFNDASGWNYGRFDQPDLPEYNFSRDVDYVSGACLVFRKDLWNDIGGFDQRFSPAYYEDTDFCFAARSRGLRVRYVPTSVVVHYEGVSHGSNEDFGVKRYQAVNRDKFAAKWHKVLDQEHYSSADELFSARLHGRNKKTLLFIDHYVPFYDKDAGSKVAQRYIELFVEEGVHVIFLGDNFYPHQPYTQELQALGVEVLYGSFYKKNWFEWLQKNSQYIDAIYLNRPHISEHYIDKILSLENVPYLAYHGADLHYVRVGREESLGIPNSEGRTSSEWKKLEFDLMRKCDVSLWLSDLEVELVRKEDPSINAVYKPMYWFSESDFNTRRQPVEERRLLFVGGFGHPPNLDGLIWFLDDIFPIVLSRHPDSKLTVIGSDCPSSVLERQCENVEVLGFVSESELVETYRHSRVSVVPLRYGAGVKGKVIESMKYGIPVITTSIGAEGLPGNPHDYLTIADEEVEFSARLIALLEDSGSCRSKTKAADQALLKYYSRASASIATKHILGLDQVHD